MASPRLAVPLPLFSTDALLCAEAEAAFPGARFNRGPLLRGEALIGFLQEADFAICSAERIDAAVLAACPMLKAFGKYGVGLDSFDLAACRAADVYVGWTAGVNSRTVAETALGLMLAVGRDLFRSALLVREGAWVRRPSQTLYGATVGIVGFGHVGQALVPLLRPFGCRILVNDILDIAAPSRALAVESVGKEQLYAEADFVTLHVPLQPGTRNLIDAAALARFKPGAFLVNTARGGVVDEAALQAALASGRLAGAALDVLAVEPPTEVTLPRGENLMLTPHIGASSRGEIQAMGRAALRHLVGYAAGRRGVDAALLFG